jgi:hypothetical protein
VTVQVVPRDSRGDRGRRAGVARPFAGQWDLGLGPSVNLSPLTRREDPSDVACLCLPVCVRSSLRPGSLLSHEFGTQGTAALAHAPAPVTRVRPGPRHRPPGRCVHRCDSGQCSGGRPAHQHTTQSVLQGSTPPGTTPGELVVLRATRPLIEVDFIHFGPTGAGQRLGPAKGPARITPGPGSLECAPPAAALCQAFVPQIVRTALSLRLAAARCAPEGAH